MENKYQKTKKKHIRGHKLTGVNIEFYQHETLKTENLNLSLLVRDFLDTYLKENFPASFDKNKNLQSMEEGEENET